MNLVKYLQARKDRILFEKLVFALVSRTDYDTYQGAHYLFEAITGRKYIPSEVYHRGPRNLSPLK